MAEVFLALFIFLGVLAVTALIFGGWVIVNVAKGIGSLVGLSVRPAAQGRFNGPPPIPAQWAGAEITLCRVPGCCHMNPVSARFCRHCGHAFPPAQPVGARRMAMS